MSTQGKPKKFMWRPSALRFSCFYSPTDILSLEGWWELFASDKPEEVIDQPRNGVHLESGPFRQGSLRLASSNQPKRIDWIYAIQPDISAPLNEFPTLGSFDEEATNFQNSLTKWLKSAKSVPAIRIAFGCELISPVTTLAKGHKLLSEYVNMEIDPSSTDFLYQINRPRKVALAGENITVNRLSKWSVSNLIQRFITGDSTIVKPHTVYACRLELDINSPQEFKGKFHGTRTERFFELFVSLAKEIAEEGDVK